MSQLPPIFMQMGYGIETYDGNGDSVMKLKDGAPEEAKKSFESFELWDKGELAKYDDFELLDAYKEWKKTTKVKNPNDKYAGCYF